MTLFAPEHPGKAPAKGKSAYASHRDKMAARTLSASASGRDIGATPLIADVKRRKKCERNFRLFCEIYNANACFWKWSNDHLRVIAAIEESVFKGALLAFAMPRGSGKSTLCRLAMLWAISFAHVGYGFLIGANEQKAVQSMSAIKGWMRCLDPWIYDFPEISHAVKALGKLANRANGQLQGLEPTDIVWEKTQLVLPKVKKPENMTWHEGAFSPTSGIVIGASGLTGEGLRGSLFSHPDGRQVRPDFILLDDPQTDDSAKSPLQNHEREELIAGAILGMANPDRPTGAVMPCTVIKPGDMVDLALDRKRNPLWRGVRTRMLKSMPTNLPAWEKYFETYTDCMGQDTPNFRPANTYYRKHRKVLDEGAEASWKERKYWEVSAVQHAMNIYCRNRRTFMAEYQNQPVDDALAKCLLTPDVLAGKLNGLARAIAPKEAEYLTAFVDVHGRLLYWHVCAWSKEFAGGPIDYGTYPRQPVRYFAQDSAPVSMASIHPGMVDDAFILASLTQTVDELLARSFTREDGATLRVNRLLIDTRWGQKTELVKTFCRRHREYCRSVMPSMGQAFGAKNRPITEYKREPGAVEGGGQGSPHHWRIGPAQNGDRWLTIDANWWKDFAAQRLATPAGTPGAWSIFGDDRREHALLFDHYTSEEPIQVAAMGRTVNEWRAKAGRPDNHWWDGLIGCAVAASWAGATIPELGKPRIMKRRNPDSNVRYL